MSPPTCLCVFNSHHHCIDTTLVTSVGLIFYADFSIHHRVNYFSDVFPKSDHQFGKCSADHDSSTRPVLSRMFSNLRLAARLPICNESFLKPQTYGIRYMKVWRKFR